MTRASRSRCNTYEHRRRLHYLRYGRSDIPPHYDRKIVLAVKVIAKIAGITVNQVHYRLNMHENELLNDMNMDDVRALRRLMKKVPADQLTSEAMQSQATLSLR